MTITSVGFGDVSASPFNVPEQICCLAIMFFTALLWGYLVGVFCTLAAAKPDEQQVDLAITVSGITAECSCDWSYVYIWDGKGTARAVATAANANRDLTALPNDAMRELMLLVHNIGGLTGV